MQLLLVSVYHRGPQPRNDVGHYSTIAHAGNKGSGHKACSCHGCPNIAPWQGHREMITGKIMLQMCCHSLTTFSTCLIMVYHLYSK